jgi:hypothetical protein
MSTTSGSPGAYASLRYFTPRHLVVGTQVYVVQPSTRPRPSPRRKARSPPSTSRRIHPTCTGIWSRVPSTSPSLPRRAPSGESERSSRSSRLLNRRWPASDSRRRSLRPQHAEVVDGIYPPPAITDTRSSSVGSAPGGVSRAQCVPPWPSDVRQWCRLPRNSPHETSRSSRGDRHGRRGPPTAGVCGRRRQDRRGRREERWLTISTTSASSACCIWTKEVRRDSDGGTCPPWVGGAWGQRRWPAASPGVRIERRRAVAHAHPARPPRARGDVHRRFRRHRGRLHACRPHHCPVGLSPLGQLAVDRLRHRLEEGAKPSPAGLFLRPSWFRRRPLLPVHQECWRLPSFIDRDPRPSHDVGGLLAGVGEPTGDEAKCAGDAVATYSRGDTVLSMCPNWNACGYQPAARVRPRGQRAGLDGDDRLRSGRLGAAICDENATSFPRSARRSMVLLTASGDTRGVTPNQRRRADSRDHSTELHHTAGTAPQCPLTEGRTHGHQSSSRM